VSLPLADFVREALLRGVPRADIARALESGGWTGKEIQAALDAYLETDLPLPVPRKRVTSSPKEAFFHLLLYSMLYTASVALGSVLFDLINLWLPLPAEPARPLLSSLRWGIATVVVSFPLFLFMSWLIAREAASNPGQRISPVRRWLTYLTLFVAAVAIVCDLIALIVTFLEGDLTLRFGLKVITVALLAAGPFTYYLSALRRDEVAPSLVRVARPAAKLALAGLVGVIVALLATAGWFAGTPMQGRLMAQDAQRLRDLNDIHVKVERFYEDKGRLPESLTACDISPNTFVRQKKDRVTGESYHYRVADDAQFEIGATFALPSSDDGEARASGSGLGPDDEDFWRHDAGPAVFLIDVARTGK
jgi:hypothetical protein